MDLDIEELVDRLRESPAIKAAIKHHLLQQVGIDPGLVRWSDGSLHRVGEDTDGD